MSYEHETNLVGLVMKGSYESNFKKDERKARLTE